MPGYFYTIKFSHLEDIIMGLVVCNIQLCTINV